MLASVQPDAEPLTRQSLVPTCNDPESIVLLLELALALVVDIGGVVPKVDFETIVVVLGVADDDDIGGILRTVKVPGRPLNRCCL